MRRKANSRSRLASSSESILARTLSSASMGSCALVLVERQTGATLGGVARTGLALAAEAAKHATDQQPPDLRAHLRCDRARNLLDHDFGGGHAASAPSRLAAQHAAQNIAQAATALF